MEEFTEAWLKFAKNAFLLNLGLYLGWKVYWIAPKNLRFLLKYLRCRGILPFSMTNAHPQIKKRVGFTKTRSRLGMTKPESRTKSSWKSVDWCEVGCAQEMPNQFDRYNTKSNAVINEVSHIRLCALKQPGYCTILLSPSPLQHDFLPSQSYIGCNFTKLEKVLTWFIFILRFVTKACHFNRVV